MASARHLHRERYDRTSWRLRVVGLFRELVTALVFAAALFLGADLFVLRFPVVPLVLMLESRSRRRRLRDVAALVEGFGGQGAKSGSLAARKRITPG